MEGAAFSALFDISTDLSPAARGAVEWGGFIYRNPDGSYSYTLAVPGDPLSVPQNNPINSVGACSGAGVPVGTYHTHTQDGDDQPSQGDYNHAKVSEFWFGEYHGYIGNSHGDLIGYDRHGIIFDTPGVFTPALNYER
jgi:hypothetical protein